jgi:hypothetical protein
VSDEREVRWLTGWCVFVFAICRQPSSSVESSCRQPTALNLSVTSLWEMLISFISTPASTMSSISPRCAPPQATVLVNLQQLYARVRMCKSSGDTVCMCVCCASAFVSTCMHLWTIVCV